MRIGEAILCGVNPLDNKIIPELFQDTFTLFLEVVESKLKGKQSSEVNRLKRILLNIGKQDTLVMGLKTLANLKIVNYSSNHLAPTTSDQTIGLGSFIEFSMDYGAMMTSMTSPNVYKYYSSKESEAL